jgi:hypothetical protein
MRTCVWCNAPLPEPEHKGHRRREFCKPPKSCKQQHYRWHKHMRPDVATLTEPFWRGQYQALLTQYKELEQLMQARLADLAEERKRADEQEEKAKHWFAQCERMRIDYVARLNALGISCEEVKAFESYWCREEKAWYDIVFSHE